ncbi:hypothetical protein HGI15_10405 [Modestobacter lapidis]|nr:hypothetical protein [Modestobacter lapidis]
MADRPGGRRPPPRPPVTSTLRPPAPRTRARLPGLLRLSTVAWLGSCLAGLLGLAAAAADVEAARDRLVAAALEDDPSRPADLVTSGVETTLTAAAGGSAVLLVLVAGCLVLVLRGRSAARWALCVVGVLTLLAVDVDRGLVDGAVPIARAAFLGQGGLVLVGLLTLVLPRSSRAWFARDRGPRAG